MSLRAEASRITSCLSARGRFGLALLGATGLIAIGCGDDEEPASDSVTQTAPAEPLEEPVTAPPPETTPPEDPKPAPEPRTVPEEELQGDEEAIRSEAVFTGRGGKITPRRIEVPAFIAIRVILRNGDGGSYSLEFDGQRLMVGHARRTDELELDGLLPQKSYEGRGPQGDVTVAATAEPGP